MTAIRLILVPYDSGNHASRHGLGPQAFLDQCLVKKIEDLGHQVDTVEIIDSELMQSEISTSFRLMGMVSAEAKQAELSEAIPIVIAGNCNCSVGAISGLAKDDLHVFWFDGNADFNTPETTKSGFLDGMGLAMLAGKCWVNMVSKIPGFKPIAENRLVLVGARDFDHEERIALENSEISLVPNAKSENQDRFSNLFKSSISERRLYIHLDLDVFNPDDAPANNYQPAGGPSVKEVQSAIGRLIDKNQLSGLTISSYDPAIDPSRKTVNATIELLCTILSKV